VLAEFIKQRKLNVDFKNSWAYADSIYDTPVLQMVGNPIATYPDKKLQRLAHSRKWPIIAGIV
jgi:putative phosphoserine phosphatase/1-acylglycerol-3-phosphate O-acyltransferase